MVSPFAKDPSFKLIESAAKGDLKDVQAMVREIELAQGTAIGN